MNKREIVYGFNLVAKKIGFKTTSKDAWLAVTSPGQYRFVVKHGLYKAARALLKVSPYENLIDIAKSLIAYDDLAKTVNGSVRVPKVIRKGKLGEVYYYLLQEKIPDGRRLVIGYPASSDTEKIEVAKMYWHTWSVFEKMRYEVKNWSVSDVLFRDLDRWLTEARQSRAVIRGIISQKEIDNTLSTLLNLRHQTDVRPFFNLFQNTDIVQNDAGYFIWSVNIQPKLEHFGIAIWLWGVTEHSSGTCQPSVMKRDLKKWFSIFYQFAPKKERAFLMRRIYLSYCERLLATLLVDLPNKRLPFVGLTEKEVLKRSIFIKSMLAFTITQLHSS